MDDKLKTNNSLMNVEQTAKYLSVSAKTVYGWISLKQIPYIKLGRLIRFKSELLEKWLLGQTINPVEL